MERFRRLPGTTLAALLLALCCLADTPPQWDFQLILARAESLYGPLGAARMRIESWRDLLAAEAAAGEADKLRAVNDFFNAQLRFEDDRLVWKQDDYWATPVEALLKGAGDCEDYALAKYFSLRRLGIAAERLRITYVKALRLSQAHMVLTYYPSPGAVPLVLDNLVGEIRPASQRDDLLPVYAFNADGLWLPGQGGGTRVGDSTRLSRWQELLAKMQAEGFPADPGD